MATTTVVESNLGPCDKENECRNEESSTGRGAHYDSFSPIQPNKCAGQQNVFKERETEGYKMEDEHDLDMGCFGPAHPLVRWSSPVCSTKVR